MHSIILALVLMVHRIIYSIPYTVGIHCYALTAFNSYVYTQYLLRKFMQNISCACAFVGAEWWWCPAQLVKAVNTIVESM